MLETSILWRRLDGPGHDACRLARHGRGHAIDGAAVLLVDGLPAKLDYRVECGPDWRTRAAKVAGWIGGRSVELRIERSEGGEWSLDGEAVAGLEDCLDLDLAFTPATNLLALRRLSLSVGESAEAPAAWLDVGAKSLTRLGQRYSRRSQASYAYEASVAQGGTGRVIYSDVLDVTEAGFVRRYPGLWEAELSRPPDTEDAG